MYWVVFPGRGAVVCCFSAAFLTPDAVALRNSAQLTVGHGSVHHQALDLPAEVTGLHHLCGF